MTFLENNPVSIERAILSTYVYLDFFCDIMHPPSMPILNEELFSIQYHRQIAKKMNKAIQSKESLSMAGYEIQDKTSGTRYETEWLEILASMPIPINTIPSYLKQLSIIQIGNKHAR